jgi:hypothetical protein
MKINHLKIVTGIVLVSTLVSVGLFSKIVLEVNARTWTLQSPIVVTKKVPQPKIVKEVEAKEIDPCDFDRIDRLICQTFGKDWKTARAIALAESHENPNALNKNTNGSYDVGIFQLNTTHFNRWTLAQMSDPKTNIQIAYQIYSEQGFNPWVAYTTGSYKKYLK